MLFEGRRDVLNPSVIASLPQGRRGNLILPFSLNTRLASPTQFANPKVCEPRLPRLTALAVRLAMTEMTKSLPSSQ